MEGWRGMGGEGRREGKKKLSELRTGQEMEKGRRGSKCVRGSS